MVTGRPELMPEGSRCDSCLYTIAGLPMKGKCPECGTKYAFGLLYRRTALSLENCPSCQYKLQGLPLRGTCPECGNDYRFDTLKRERPASGWGGVWRWLCDRLPRFDFKIAFVLLIIATTILLGITGWAAFSTLLNLLRSESGV